VRIGGIAMAVVAACSRWQSRAADQGGITRDIALDTDGIRTVLALRRRCGTPRKTLTDPAPYIDRSYCDQALGKR
jgi:hypothetical protein